MLGRGQRLFSKGINNASSSYHMLPWYLQCANACFDAFAHDLVPQGWKGQPLSSGIPQQNLDTQFSGAREAAAFPLCFQSPADQ